MWGRGGVRVQGGVDQGEIFESRFFDSRRTNRSSGVRERRSRREIRSGRSPTDENRPYLQPAVGSGGSHTREATASTRTAGSACRARLPECAAAWEKTRSDELTHGPREGGCGACRDCSSPRRACEMSVDERGLGVLVSGCAPRRRPPKRSAGRGARRRARHACAQARGGSELSLARGLHAHPTLHAPRARLARGRRIGSRHNDGWTDRSTRNARTMCRGGSASLTSRRDDRSGARTSPTHRSAHRAAHSRSNQAHASDECVSWDALLRAVRGDRRDRLGPDEGAHAKGAGQDAAWAAQRRPMADIMLPQHAGVHAGAL